jgi:hypothetical protein
MMWPNGMTPLGFEAISPPNRSTTASGENSARTSKILFRDVAADAGITPWLTCGSLEKGYILQVYGGGCVLLDYNNYGYVDIYTVNGSTVENLLDPTRVKNPPDNYFFRNNCDGTFTDVTRQVGVEGYGWGFGAVAADYSNDGFVDLFVYNYGPNILYENTGDVTFTDVTPQAGIAGRQLVWSTGEAG